MRARVCVCMCVFAATFQKRLGLLHFPFPWKEGAAYTFYTFYTFYCVLKHVRGAAPGPEGQQLRRGLDPAAHRVETGNKQNKSSDVLSG